MRTRGELTSRCDLRHLCVLDEVGVRTIASASAEPTIRPYAATAPRLFVLASVRVLAVFVPVMPGFDLTCLPDSALPCLEVSSHHTWEPLNSKP